METFEVAEEQPYIYRLTGLGIEAARRGRGLELAYQVSRLIWGGTSGWDQGDHLANAVAVAGLDLEELECALIANDATALVGRRVALVGALLDVRLSY